MAWFTYFSRGTVKMAQPAFIFFGPDRANHRGERHIQGGRSSVRCVRYMATLTARTFNPLIKAMSDRLTRAGKPFKVVMTACMRKLLTILNTMAHTGEHWRTPCVEMKMT